MPFPTQMNRMPVQAQQAGGQRGIVNQYSGGFMPQGMSMQQAMAQRGMQMPTRPSQQQFAPPMGAAPLPNPTAAPPMLQPAGMSPLGPQQTMPYGMPPSPQAPQTEQGPPAWMQAQALAARQAQQGMPPSPQGMGQPQGLNVDGTPYASSQPQGGMPGFTQGGQMGTGNPNQLPAGIMDRLQAQQNMPSPPQQGMGQFVQGGQMGTGNPNQLPAGIMGRLQAQQGLGQLTQKYAEGGQVQMPDPNAWRPPVSTLGQMPPSMTMQPPMPQMGAQGAAPTGLAQPMPAAMQQRFANGGPVGAQTQFGGTQIAQRYAKGGKANHLANTAADDQVIQALRRDPQFDAIIAQGHDELGDMPIEALNEFISMIRMALRSPEKYPEIRMAAIKDKMVEPEDMPEQFDGQFLASMLTTLVALKKRQEGKTTKMATGGLANAAQTLQKKGRNGDTILAHINPQEAAMLRAQGGTGTINPATGLVEYGFFSKLWKGIVKIAKVIAPIALTFLVPAAGAWIGSTFLGGLGAAGSLIGGGMIAGAAAGAAGAAIQGGDIGKGALIGGALGGFQGGYSAYKASQAAKALTASGQASGAAGASGAAEAASAATPASTAVDQAAGALKTTGAVGGPASQATLLTGGNAAAAPFNPLTASAADVAGQNAATLATGATGATGAIAAPIQAAAPSFTDKLISGAAKIGSKAVEKLPSLGGEVLKTGALMAAAGALGGGGGAPADVMPEVQKLSASQQEYFNRPNIQWDWDRIKSDAASTGMSLAEFMNQNWGAISGGSYNTAQTNMPSDQVQKAARGGRSLASSGALSKMAYLAEGSGSGRADTIDAKLSDGEYVIDAETVALLGDGSTKEGARRLDMMRQQLRQQKGKQLARGKFSTSAKMPLAYLAGAR